MRPGDRRPAGARTRLRWLAVAALACGLPVFARQAPAAGSPEALKRLSLEQLAEMPVTSVTKRPEPLLHTASALQVISAEQIRRSGATCIAEALRLADNLDVARVNAHAWAITARGFNTSLANKLLVLIDGRSVYTPLFSGVFWDRQDYLLADIERIEVISGPGGTLWGANAVNGVINIITKNARDTQGTLLEAASGSQLRALAGVREGGMLAPGVAFRAYAKYTDRGGDELADGAPARDGWHLAQGGFRLDAGGGRRDALTLQGDAYSADEGVIGGGAQHAGGANLLGRWTRVLSEHSDFSLQAYYDRTHFEQPVPALVFGTTPLAPAGRLRDDLDTFDLQFEHRLRAGDRHHLVWGAGYRRTSDEVAPAPALAFVPSRLRQNLYSAFVQDEFALREDVVATAGTKVEHNDYTGFELEPSARLQWNIDADRMVWAAVSRAVRTPSRVDRDLREPAPPAAVGLLEGSPDFDSETVVADEIGWRARAGSAVTVAAAAFYNDYADLRSTTLTPTTLLPLYFRNDLEGHTSGIELTANWQVLDNWRLHGGYAWLREDLRVKPGAVDINAAHNETADPAHRLRLHSALDLPHALEFDADLRWVGARTLNSGSTLATLPAYTDLDLRIGWRMAPGVELSLTGQNLLHARHVEYGFPTPLQAQIGRSVYGKIAWRF